MVDVGALAVIGLTVAGAAGLSAWQRHLSPSARRNRALCERALGDPTAAREPIPGGGAGLHYRTSRFGPTIDVEVHEHGAVVSWRSGGPVPGLATVEVLRKAKGLRDLTVDNDALAKAVEALESEFSMRWRGLSDTGLRAMGSLHEETADDITPQRLARLEALMGELVAAAAGLFGEEVRVSAPCPRCGGDLKEAVGALHESVCGGCGWRFLHPDAAREALWEPLGLSPGELKDAASGAYAPNLCLGCGEPMRAVLLEESIGEVCAHCGSAGLDAGELEAMTGGQYRG